jgi:hypothetical protein
MNVNVRKAGCDYFPRIVLSGQIKSKDVSGTEAEPTGFGKLRYLLFVQNVDDGLPRWARLITSCMTCKY